MVDRQTVAVYLSSRTAVGFSGKVVEKTTRKNHPLQHKKTLLDKAESEPESKSDVECSRLIF